MTLPDEHRVRFGKLLSGWAMASALGGLVALLVLLDGSTLRDLQPVSIGIFALGFGALGWVTIPSQPRNGAVWALQWGAFFGGLYLAALAFVWLVTSDEVFDAMGGSGVVPAQLPLSSALAVQVAAFSLFPAFALMISFAVLLFPDGHLPSKRWRWVGWLMAVSLACDTIGLAYLFRPSTTIPFRGFQTFVNLGETFQTLEGFDRDVADIVGLFGVLFTIANLAAVASLVTRSRRGDAVTKRRIKWVAIGYLVLPINVTLTRTWPFYRDVLINFPLLTVSLIATYWVAIRKYRLYDIDVVISKSVTYLGLAAVITAIFALVVAGPTIVLGESGGGGVREFGLPIVATGVVAMVFEPVRSRMQRWANRLVYGERSTPYEVLSQLTSELSETRRGGADIAKLVAEGTGAEQAVVWLQQGDVLEPEQSWPPQVTSDELVYPADLVDDEFMIVGEVRHLDQPLGALSVIKPRNDAVTPGDRELVSDVAAGAGLLLRNIALHRQLEERAREVRQSRLRLVVAQDNERHRLERDLHDGAQQQVVALKVKLGLAKTLASRAGADDVATLVAGLADDTQNAVDALRTVAHGIYPPLLEAEGLAVALRAVERTATQPLVIETEGLTRYERRVEETVYFCVLEGIERTHMAGASIVHVNLTTATNEVLVDIDHDGDITEADLTALTDRIDAHGGVTVIEARTKGLNRISSRVPVPNPVVETL